MALDATPAGAAADSYIDVATADALAANDLGGFVGTWTAADTDTKERALKKATRMIDAYVIGDEFIALTETQSLLFPRVQDTDDAGVAIIPKRLALATYEQAKHLIANADLLEAAASRRARGLTNFSEPNVSGSISENADLGRMAPEVIDYLAGYAPGAGGAIVGWIETT